MTDTHLLPRRIETSCDACGARLVGDESAGYDAWDDGAGGLYCEPCAEEHPEHRLERAERTIARLRAHLALVCSQVGSGAATKDQIIEGIYAVLAATEET